MSKSPIKICVVTATRAEYGFLYWLLKRLDEDPDIDLQLVATGAHLSPEYGLTVRNLEADGFTVNAKVEMLLSSDTRLGTARSMSLGISGLADAFDRLAPSLVVVCGDRYEMLSAAQAALILRIPVAHIAGGDTTEGAFDESIRHSISKMSHLHFVTNSESGRRVRQLGENPDLIFNVGSLGLEQVERQQFDSRSAVEASINFKLRSRNALITFHPVTLEDSSLQEQQNLLTALDELGADFGLIFTGANADPGGRVLNEALSKFVDDHENAIFHSNLGQSRYLNVVNQVDVVVGNSSSGLYEVPSFKKPTVNIGDRQLGRARAKSVIDCEPTVSGIRSALEKAFELDCSTAVNPYQGNQPAEKIVGRLKEHASDSNLLKKKFFDLEISEQ